MPNQSFVLPVIKWASPGCRLRRGGAGADVTTVIVLSVRFADSNASTAPEGHRLRIVGESSFYTYKLCLSCLSCLC